MLCAIRIRQAADRPRTASFVLLAALLALLLASAGCSGAKGDAGTGAEVAGATSKTDKIDALMDLSGIERQIAQFPALMRHQAAQQQQDLPPDVKAAMTDALVDAFDPERLLVIVRGHIDAQYNDAYMDEALAWLRAPLGRRMTQMEIAVSTVEGQQAQQAFVKNWQRNPPPQDRVRLVARYADATGANHFSPRLIATTFEAMMRGMMALMPPERRMSEEKLDALKKRMVERLAEPLRNRNVANMTYTYRELTDAELEQAIAFYESKGGGWYQDAVSEGLLRGVAEAGVVFGQQMERLRQQMPQRS